jgi:hypothetical protein
MSDIKNDYFVVYNFSKGEENGCGSMYVNTASGLTAAFISYLQENIKKENELTELLITNIIKLEKSIEQPNAD